MNPCETCGRLSELFQLPGRSDYNCAECNLDIAKLVSLYRRLETQTDGDEANLKDQILTVLQRLFARFGQDLADEFYAWHEDKVTVEHVN